MKICNDLCNFPRIANTSREKVYCSVCAKLYHESYAQKNRCICCGTPVRLFNKTRKKKKKNIDVFVVEPQLDFLIKREGKK